MKIGVTQKHIDEGEPNSCGYCPVALALFELSPMVSGIYPIGIGYVVKIYSLTSRVQKTIYIPDDSHIKEFIQNFDKGKAVNPFEFEIDFENNKIRDIT